MIHASHDFYKIKIPILNKLEAPRSLYSSPGYNNISQPEALKSLYRSPGNKN